MMKIKSAIAGILLALFIAAPASAQFTGQLGSGQLWANPTSGQTRGQPIGLSPYMDFVFGSTRGGIIERGATGWAKVNPSSTSAIPWVSNGTGADPAYQALTGAGIATNTVAFSNIVQDPTAWSLLGNASASAPANYGPFTIGGLTNKPSPATTDLLILQDQAAAGALKYCTIAQCIAAVTSGVSSIDAKTGAFTTGNGIDSTAGNVIELTAARRTLPTTQTFTSGTGLTYTTPANALWLEVYACGGGGGGAGAGTSTTVAGSGGGTTTFNSINAAGGGGAAGIAAAGSALGGAGGTGGTGTATRRMPGSPGGSGYIAAGTSNISTNFGGASALLGGGGIAAAGGTAIAGSNAVANTGSGGGGARNNSSTDNWGGGGGGGECFYLEINSPAASYTYTVGAGGNGGSSTQNGGNGAAGYIQVVEHYGS